SESPSGSTPWPSRARVPCIDLCPVFERVLRFRRLSFGSKGPEWFLSFPSNHVHADLGASLESNLPASPNRAIEEPSLVACVHPSRPRLRRNSKDIDPDRDMRPRA